MTQSPVNAIFGIHTMTAYNVVTGVPYGTARVNASAEITMEGEIISLNGGSSKHSWKNERGLIKTEVSITIKEYTSFLFGRLLGKDITENAAETGGFCSTLTAKSGTGLVVATGIATATVKSGSETDLKFDKFLVVAASATTVDVYGYSDVDYANGTDLVVQNDGYKITASPLTITTSTAVEIPGTGVELTGDSGIIALVTGETASFYTRPINTGSREVVIGSSSEVFSDFGLTLTAGRQSDGTMVELDCYKCTGAGMPINFTENAYSELSVTLQMSRDTTQGGLFKYTDARASN